MKKRLSQLIVPERVCDLSSEDKIGALTELVDLLANSPHVADKEAVLTAVLERERVISTGIGIGIAVPHVKIPQIKDFVIAVGRSEAGIEFQSLDDDKVHLVIMIGANDRQSGDYLKILAEIIKRCKDKENRDAILKAKNAREVAGLFA